MADKRALSQVYGSGRPVLTTVPPEPWRLVQRTWDQAIASPHIRFPGLFNRCELYVNGKEIARREQNVLWWTEDYRFEWDVSLEDRLRAGENAIALRCHGARHMGGMFRRPFLYAPR